MQYKYIRSGRGLGDSLYLYPLVKHLRDKGEKLIVATDWPDVFANLISVKTVEFTRQGINIIAHYTSRKQIKETKQFKDMCLQAGVQEDVDFNITWELRNTKLVKEIRSLKKKILLIQLPRYPMGREDGFAFDLLPKKEILQQVINQAKKEYCIIQIGKGHGLYQFEGIDMHLENKTTIEDLFDLVTLCHCMVGYCSYMVPLAELFDKKALFVWSYMGLKSQTMFINTITPYKILSKPSSFFVIDNWKNEDLEKEINEFLQ